MAEKTINIQSDPQLPEMFADARRNHGGQTVPQDFFAQFEKKMNAVIDADILLQQAEKQPLIKWYRQKRTWMSLAASFVLIVVLGIAFQFEQWGHKLGATTQETSNVADMLFDDDDFLDMPDEMIEETILAATNDYELYEYYCEI